MLLVDDDQAELGEGQEQRRAGAGHNPHRTVGDAAPDPLPDPWRDLGMPLGRPRAEARCEALDEALGQRDLGDEDQRLPATTERLGDRLEIDLGLARPGDAVDQRHRGAAGGDRLPQCRGAGGLLGIEDRCGMVRVGNPRHRRPRHFDGRQRARLEQPRDDAGADPRRGGEGRLRPRLAVRHDLKHAASRRRHARGRRPREVDAGDRRLGLERAGRAKHHPEHHAAAGHGVVRHPVDEGADLLRQRRRLVLFLYAPQAVMADLGVGRIVPHDADDVARAQRHPDDVARRDAHARRHRVAVGRGDGDGDEDGDDGFTHGTDMGGIRSATICSNTAPVRIVARGADESGNVGYGGR